jgi:6-phosphogluconolactonase
MVDEALLSKLGAHEGPHLHPVRGELGPEDAAWLYGTDVVRAMGEQPVFDLVLLGMGPDGHTASLFPDHPAARASEAPVIGVRDSPKPPPERITLTLPVLKRARFTLLMATGAEKREALAGVRAGDDRLPAARMGDGLDEIVCDEAAVGPSTS